MATPIPGSLAGALCSLDELPAIEPDQRGVPAGPLITADDEVHLWYAVADHRDPALTAAYDQLLTDDESARQARFVRAVDRDLHRLTRALQRTVLSRYAPVAPQDWRFARDHNDKPVVAGPAGVAWPRFNLSNSHGLVACAVSSVIPLLGVDVEPINRRVELEQLADRFFSPSEAADLRATAAADQPLRFFTYWTLKEAHVKACGQGLSMPLDQFAFQLATGGEITVAFDPQLADDAAAWRYRLLQAPDHHLAAVAARVGRGRGLVVKAARCTPLRGALSFG